MRMPLLEFDVECVKFNIFICQDSMFNSALGLCDCGFIANVNS